MPDVSSTLVEPRLLDLAFAVPWWEVVAESHMIQQMMEGYLTAWALALGTLETMVVGEGTVPRCPDGLLGQYGL